MEYDFGQATISLIPSIALQGRIRAAACFKIYSAHSAKNTAQQAMRSVQSAAPKNVSLLYPADEFPAGAWRVKRE
jgi:hypothetical protein